MKEKHVAIENELNQIMFELGMDPFGELRSFRWLKELILLSVYDPNGWQNNYLENIGNEGLTRERVRQILYKAAWDNWSVKSKDIFENHLGYPVKTQFQYIKPNHIEFIELISTELRKKHDLR